MVRIGCDNLVYAKMTAEDTPTTAPKYSTPTRLVGVMTLNINPNASLETLFADDGQLEVAGTLGVIEVEIQKAYLTAADKNALLGHVVDDDGGVTFAANDVSPWVAIGFRTLKSNGKYRYVWLYKGKFLDPEDNNETKGDTINFQSDTINGQFAKLLMPYTVDEEEKYPWKYELDADTPTASSAKIEAWFSAVQFPKVDTP